MNPLVIDIEEIEVSGRVIEIVRKDIKHFHLFVNPPFGHISASAPYKMDISEIEGFVNRKSEWIDKQVREFAERNWTSVRQFVSGESIWIFGRQCFLKIENGKWSFTWDGRDAVLIAPVSASVKKRREYVYGVLRRELRQRAEAMLPGIAKEIGVMPNEVIIQEAGTRWGNCSRKTGNIFVNTLMVHQSNAALRLVLVYECLHLLYNPNDKKFQRKLEELVPDWRGILDKMNAVPLPID